MCFATFLVTYMVIVFCYVVSKSYGNRIKSPIQTVENVGYIQYLFTMGVLIKTSGRHLTFTYPPAMTTTTTTVTTVTATVPTMATTFVSIGIIREGSMVADGV